MNPEKKRKLRNIALLALLGLIGGTFAFQSFNQQAINDREGQNDHESAGRIHDYFNRETENKDVFVENYGDGPLLVRIQLKEYLAKNGESIVYGAEQENVGSWTTWLPAAGDIHKRSDRSPSEAFDRYTNWSFGNFSSASPPPVGMSNPRNRLTQAPRSPSYMPTFNHDRDDERTAAAGDARDYVEGGATHPGDGTEGYWDRNSGFQNYDPELPEEERTALFPGRPINQSTESVLGEDRPPITMTEWETLDENQKVGNYWVVDEESGYAYWASYLMPGQATAYFLDQTDMADAIKKEPGSWFYAIHVSGDMVSPSETNIAEFFAQGGDTARARDLVNRMGETSIPNFNGDIDPGDSFYVEGAEYLYVSPHGGGHLVVPMQTIGQSTFGETTDYMSSNVRQMANNFYALLPAQLQRRVLPVSYGSTRGIGDHELNDPWSSEKGQDMENYFTRVDAENGERTAFIMSMADIMFHTRGGIRNEVSHPPFPDFWSRTTVGYEGPPYTRVFGFSESRTEEYPWRKWQVNETKDVLPALMLSQIGEMQK